MRDRNAPHILAIVFEEYVDDYSGHVSRTVRDICRVEGTDKNARRRLRRQVLRNNYMGGVSVVRYETHPGGDAEEISKDVTRFYKRAIAEG